MAASVLIIKNQCLKKKDVHRKHVYQNKHYAKSICIRSYSGPYSPVFGLNTKKYRVSLRIQPKCGKMRTKITPNTDTFYAMKVVGPKPATLIKKRR